MKDIRREIEQRTEVRAALPVRAAAAREAVALMEASRAHHRVPAPLAQVLVGLRHADQAEGAAAAAPDDDHDDVRGRRPVGRARRGRPCSAASCRRAARARSTTSTTATSTPRWAARPSRPVPGRADLAARRADLRVRAADRCRSRSCWRPAVEPARRVPRPAPGSSGTRSSTRVWLKRRSPQNIVIGGAAGAVPPLVGWAAVTGSVAPAALYLFAIVFYWTPPHFWALSLLMKDEYARVGVPMMPVVHGETETRRQIVLYTLLLTVLTLLPVVFGFFGVDLRRLRRRPGRGLHHARAAPAAPRRPRERAAHVPVLARLPRGAVRRDGRSTPGCRLRRRMDRTPRPPQPPHRLLRRHHRRC